MDTSAKHFRKRDAILTCLRQHDNHPSAETLFALLKPQIPDLSLGTVYRNLNLFKQQGLVTSSTVQGVERFDAITHPHVHFICKKCNAVVDLDTIQVPPPLREAAAVHCGGQVQGCQLNFTGLCRDCVSQKETP